jgi:hypothetical protein
MSSRTVTLEQEIILAEFLAEPARKQDCPVWAGVLQRLLAAACFYFLAIIRVWLSWPPPRVLKPALGGNREYFHSHTLGDADRLEPRGTLNFI